MRRGAHVLVAVVAVASLSIAACGSGGGNRTSAHPGGDSGTSAPGPVRGSLTVFAAASLTEALDDVTARLVAENPGLHVTYSFGGSQQLVAQVTAGAPADVVATADEDQMARLVKAGLVDPPRVFARNRLAIAVPPGNPKAIRGLGDLARNELRVVLADPSVPAGRYSRQALDAAGVVVMPASLELDVRSVLRRVSSGEADAGVVYVTDVQAAGPSVAGVDVPDSQNVEARYPAAVVRATGNHQAAEAFVDQLVSGPGQASLLAHGFLPG